MAIIPNIFITNILLLFQDFGCLRVADRIASRRAQPGFFLKLDLNLLVALPHTDLLTACSEIILSHLKVPLPPAGVAFGVRALADYF